MGFDWRGPPARVFPSGAGRAKSDRRRGTMTLDELKTKVPAARERLEHLRGFL